MHSVDDEDSLEDRYRDTYGLSYFNFNDFLSYRKQATNTKKRKPTTKKPVIKRKRRRLHGRNA